MTTNDTPALTIEVGKFYRTRDGRKVGPMVDETGDFGANSDDMDLDDHVWQSDGTEWEPECDVDNSHLDLIAEWTDTPEATMDMTKWVSTDYAGSDYITPGKRYEVFYGGDRGFDFRDDNGAYRYSHYKSTFHLNGNDWTVHDTLAIKLEVGKTYELNNGEVYECKEIRGGGLGYFVIDGCDYHKDGRFCGCDEGHKFSVKREVISDATEATPKTWGEMTDAEKGALLLAEHECNEVEVMISSIDHTGAVIDSEWVGLMGQRIKDDWVVRIKPDQERKTVTLYGYVDRGSFDVGTGPLDTHRITFTTTGGVPDTDSVKMECV